MQERAGSYVIYTCEEENKKTRAFGECLGTKRRGRTQHFAKSRGEARATIDPRVSEWGNPPYLCGIL